MAEPLPLATLQRLMLAGISRAASGCCGPDPELDEVAERIGVRGDRRASGASRLRVHGAMILPRMEEALAEILPTVRLLLPPETFTALVAAYTDAHPSRDPSLRELGREMPTFLQGAGARFTEGCATLPDVARLDRHRRDVFDELDEPVWTLAAVRSLDLVRFADLPLRLVKAHRLCTMPGEVLSLWRSARGAPAGVERQVDPGMVLVFRQGTVVYHRPVAPTEAWALSAIRDGLSFGTLCERVAAATEAEPVPAADAQVLFDLLRRWLDDELLVDPSPTAVTP